MTRWVPLSPSAHLKRVAASQHLQGYHVHPLGSLRFLLFPLLSDRYSLGNRTAACALSENKDTRPLLSFHGAHVCPQKGRGDNEWRAATVMVTAVGGTLMVSLYVMYLAQVSSSTPYRVSLSVL